MFIQEYDYVQTKEIMAGFDKGSPYYLEFLSVASNLTVLIDMMLNCMDYYFENEELAPVEDRLKGGDKTRIASLLVTLPYYMLMDKYEGIEIWIGAFLTLTGNYFNLYEEGSEVISIIETVSKALSVPGAFVKLLISAQVLTTKMESLLKIADICEVGLSNQFITSMMGTHIDDL